MEIEDVKKYDNKKYYDNFKNKNGQRLKEKFICDICGGSYTYFNKSHHSKTKRHQIKDIEDKIIEILEDRRDDK